MSAHAANTMNSLRWSFRTAFLLGFLICVALLAYALYEELYRNQIPCYLCVMQ
ncbi:MAG: disulfide bond formation protein B, partial [Rhodanobacteraceae bacterium]